MGEMMCWIAKGFVVLYIMMTYEYFRRKEKYEAADYVLGVMLGYGALFLIEVYASFNWWIRLL